MTSLEEIAGGEYSIPLTASAWTQSDKEEIVGFIPGTDGDVTAITFGNGLACADVYTGCLAGHYYKFRNGVKAVTFGIAVTAIFKEA